MTFQSSPDSKWFSVIFVQANRSSCLRGRKPLQPPPYTHTRTLRQTITMLSCSCQCLFTSQIPHFWEKKSLVQKRWQSKACYQPISSWHWALARSLFFILLSFSIQRPNSRPIRPHTTLWLTYYQKTVFRMNVPAIYSSIEVVFIVMDLITFRCPVSATNLIKFNFAVLNGFSLKTLN